MDPTRRDVLLAGGAVLAACALPRLSRASLRRSMDLFGWQQLRPGVWASSPQDLRTGGNVLLVASRQRALLVDAKFAYLGPALRQQAEARAAPLAALVNTHHHADHSGGNVAFHDHVPVIAHHAAAPRIHAQTERYLQQVRSGPRQLSGQTGDDGRDALALAQQLAERIDQLTPDHWAPSRTVGDFSIETVGDLAVELHHVGAGHTDNDLIVHLPAANVLHPGDLLFHRLHPFFDPPAGATIHGWIRALDAAIRLCNDDTIVVPGHGDITDIAGLRAQRDYLVQLRDHVAEAIDRGASRDETTAMSWPFMAGLGFEQIREVAIGAVYDELAAGRG